MPNFIAIDWDQNQLYGLEAAVANRRVRVRQSFHLTWPKDPDQSQDNRSSGEWFKDGLARRGVRARQVLVSLPRE